MLKNTVFRSGSHALGVPTGTGTIGPDSPQNGQTRYNTTTGKLEFYNSSLWNAVAREGTANVVVNSFTGNSSRTDYGPLSYTMTSGQEPIVLVHVGTVYQIPVTNYTFYANGYTNIHFVSAPSDGAAITIIHGLASTTAA